MNLARCLSASLLLTAALVSAQTPTPAEIHTQRAFEAARKLGPPALYAFLARMPKGADLHMHLSGAVYAETLLHDAVAQGFCVNLATLSLTAPEKPQDCAKGDVPAANTLTDQHLYDALIDSFSMRGFVPTAGVTGHDQFFATFARFGAAKNPGEWLEEVVTRAASQNEQYLEIMQTPPFSHSAALGNKIGWDYDEDHDTHMQSFATLREKLLADGLKEEVATDLKDLSDAEAAREHIEDCDEKRLAPDHKEGQAASQHHDPFSVRYADDFVSTPCSVKIHFLYQILRANPPQQVFAQTLLGFEVAEAALKANPASPLVVGINFVQPEDNRIVMADYHLQMQMLDYLHSVYPDVKISLHAGELANGIVPPGGMSFHIREAVDLGHASRIGHGVDIMQETAAAALLKQMAAQHIMVEVNLTSNDGILGVKGADHPLHSYIAAHVPWALSTDDEGVSRIDLTHEYVKAAVEQNLIYADLKRSARTSIEHSFLAGPSLYPAPDDFAHRTAACAIPITATAKPASTCANFLSTSEKASAQYELERRFAVFEAAY